MLNTNLSELTFKNFLIRLILLEGSLLLLTTIESNRKNNPLFLITERWEFLLSIKAYRVGKAVHMAGPNDMAFAEEKDHDR